MASSTDFAHLPTTYVVGNLTLAPNIVLAPMASVTDSSFRRLIRSFGGCGLVTTEMTNASSVSPKALKRHRLLDFQPCEHPLAMQISGSDPTLIAQAAQVVEQLGADILDLNCGCPSPKVTGGGHGASLLRDLPKLSQVLAAAVGAVNIPVTLKFRAGWDAKSLNYLETAKRAEAAGIAALAIHPRTREQRYTGEANWHWVAEVKQAVGIPVLGNGDLKDAQAALQHLATSAVDGVMIGRAALANPWIFRQIAQLRHGEPLFSPSPWDKYQFLQSYLAFCLEEMNERGTLNKLKQLIGQLALGLPNSTNLRAAVQHAKSLAEAQTQLEIFFAPWDGLGSES